MLAQKAHQRNRLLVIPASEIPSRSWPTVGASGGFAWAAAVGDGSGRSGFLIGGLAGWSDREGRTLPVARRRACPIPPHFSSSFLFYPNYGGGFSYQSCRERERCRKRTSQELVADLQRTKVLARYSARATPVLLSTRSMLDSWLRLVLGR